MAVVKKSVLTGHSARQMFDLVDRVEHYPDFLPWCGGSEVVHETDEQALATVHINYHHIRHSFTTRNRRLTPSRIEMTLQDGPFRHLDGCWCFTELAPDACKVEFQLHYEFSSRLLEKVFGPVFSHITNSFVDAFVAQAERKYGAS